MLHIIYNEMYKTKPWMEDFIQISSLNFVYSHLALGMVHKIM